jgi:ATP-dependent exoDNAse (exonuclease V) alpha subunit
MAIYHLHVKVIGRKSGSSAVASAAYRSGSRLRDERIDRSHDFSGKRGVVHSEVMLPENAPQGWSDRERLWNNVEAGEVRKDAQLAREVEFAIPREMSKTRGIELARDFVRAEFVDRGMIADLNVHWDFGEDGMPKPHAHVMLTMRAVDEKGFGKKVRDWNRTEMVERLASWSAMPEREKARCWAWRGRLGKPQAMKSGAQLFPASRQKTSKADPNDEVRALLAHVTDWRDLNEAARMRMRVAGDLGDEVRVAVERGERGFARGDRIAALFARFTRAR